ncbi:MAG: MFS transporter [Coriobacteriia bacterium]|nr:MFS transporter [Coriobacteriia bacterium]
MRSGRSAHTPRTVTVAYLSASGIFALAMSLIWATNTIYLMRVGGLDIFQVMLVNTAFTVSQLLCEVPTGVVADTIGRRASILIAMGMLFVSTLLYVATPVMGWGMTGFVGASILLGVGYTFQTGSVEAWLVDALDGTGSTVPKEQVFARGQIAFGVGMLSGSIIGGLLGQVDLAWPFLLRAVLLVVEFGVVWALVFDIGFDKRPLTAANFGVETRRILATGVRYGMKNRVVRPLFLVSGLSGLFFMFAFYAWQPYVLELLGYDYVWVLGLAQAAFSVAGIAGNSLVGRLMRDGVNRRDPARFCAVAALAEFVIAVAIAGVGLLAAESGVVPAAIALGLWVAWGGVFGVYGPVRAAYLNAHIPSSERATVLSVDALFADVGGAVGQPALGYVSHRASISVAWLIGSLGLAASAPLYLASGRAAAQAEATPD